MYCFKSLPALWYLKTASYFYIFILKDSLSNIQTEIIFYSSQFQVFFLGFPFCIPVIPYVLSHLVHCEPQEDDTGTHEQKEDIAKHFASIKEYVVEGNGDQADFTWIQM